MKAAKIYVGVPGKGVGGRGVGRVGWGVGGGVWTTPPPFFGGQIVYIS